MTLRSETWGCRWGSRGQSCRPERHSYKQHKIMIRFWNLMKGACSISDLLGMDEPIIPSISSLSEWECLLSYDHPTVVFWRQVTFSPPPRFHRSTEKEEFCLRMNRIVPRVSTMPDLHDEIQSFGTKWCFDDIWTWVDAVMCWNFEGCWNGEYIFYW